MDDKIIWTMMAIETKRSSKNREVTENSASDWACHNEMPLVGAMLCSSLDIGM